MRMIRRTLWATAMVGLALAAAAQAQTEPAFKAALGQPRPAGSDYVARGVAPNPGYPAFAPRTYTVPTQPTFTAAPALLPVAGGSGFAQDKDTPAKTGPAPRTDLPKPGTVDSPKTTGPEPRAVDSGGGFAADQLPATATPGPVTGGSCPTGTCGTGSFGAGSFTTMLGYTPGPLPNAWASIECLNWRFKGVTVPPLVTVAPAGASGVLGDPTTAVVFGGPDLATDWNSGYRIRLGMWFDGGCNGFDFGYFAINNVGESFGLGSSGDPGIFRPFYNTAINAEDAQLVSFIDPAAGPVVGGRIFVSTSADLRGAELNYRTGYSSGLGARFDLLCGYRYLSLKETMTIRSDLTTLAAAGAAPAGTTIFTADMFDTKTQFHGAQVGLAGEWQIGCMTFGCRGTVAAGVSIQEVNITGATGSTTPTGATVMAPGGLYALPTNIGSSDRTRFACASELGATVGYQLSNNCRVFAGYDFLYWTQVVRAGEQIDRQVNGTAIPDPTTGLATPIGPPAPARRSPRDEYFYAHGFSVGLEFRY